MVLTGVCGFIPLYKLQQYWLELISFWITMARSKSTGVDHTLWGWWRQTQLILVIIAMFGSTSQVCVYASTLKVCQDRLCSSRSLEIKEPSLTKHTLFWLSASGFQEMQIHMFIAAKYWQIGKMLYLIVRRCTSRYNLLSPGISNHSVFLALPAASLLSNIKQRTELVDLRLQEL